MKYFLKPKLNILFFCLLIAFIITPVAQIKSQINVEILDNAVIYNNDDSITIKFITNVPTQGTVFLGEKEDAMVNYVGNSGPANTINEITMPELKPNTTYYYQIVVYYNSGEAVKSFIKSFKTGNYSHSHTPEVKNLEIVSIGGTWALIKWQTDRESTSLVEYSTADEKGNISYQNRAYNDQLVKNHYVAIYNLNTFNQYYIRVSSDSLNKKQNLINYSYWSFFTLISSINDKEDLTLNFIRPSSPEDSYIAETNLTVGFRTSRVAHGAVYVDGPNIQNNRTNLDYDTKFTATYLKLVPDTTYNVAITMWDVLNKYSEYRFQVKTKSAPVAAKIENKNINESANQPLNSDGSKFYSDVENKKFNYENFTTATALFKERESGKIYAIVNNQKNYISSMSSFKKYGYNWKSIKTINNKDLKKFPVANLVKIPNSSSVYYLSLRPNGKILKLLIPSPQIFSSYPENSWQKVITITQEDLNSYSDARLVSVKKNSEIYYLENGIKHLVSAQAFKEKNFSRDEILIINQQHLDSYQTGYSL